MRKEIYVDTQSPIVFTQEDGTLASRNTSNYELDVDDFSNIMRTDVEINRMVRDNLWEGVL
jgi:hypothetical protein